MVGNLMNLVVLGRRAPFIVVSALRRLRRPSSAKGVRKTSREEPWALQNAGWLIGTGIVATTVVALASVFFAPPRFGSQARKPMQVSAFIIPT